MNCNRCPKTPSQNESHVLARIHALLDEFALEIAPQANFYCGEVTMY